MPREKINNQQKILFVINPISGDIDKDNLNTDIKNYMLANHQAYEIYYTKGEDDQQNILESVERIKPRTVVAVGGDGTCNLVGHVLLYKDIRMGIIPLGSANGLATELNLPTDHKESLDIILNGKTRKIDALQINNEHISLHLSDIGFNAKIIERFEKGKARGFLGYVKHFFDEIPNIKSTRFKLELDNKTKTKKAIMIVIANSTKYGTGAVVNPNGKPDDGRFELVVFRPQTLKQYLKMLIPFLTRQLHKLNFIDIYTCKKLIIRNKDHQKLQIDGEIIGQPEEVYVEILPHSLLVIVP